MQVYSKHGHGFARRSNLRDRLEYRLILALCFGLYFFVVLLRRLIGSLLGKAVVPNEKRPSVVEETSAAARIAAGYAFMS